MELTKVIFSGGLCQMYEKECIYTRECSQHCSAGVTRKIVGFTPTIFQDDSTKDLFCETIDKNPVINKLPLWPQGHDKKTRGFKKL